MYGDYDMDFGRRKKRVGRPRGKGRRGKYVIVKGRKRKIYRGKTGALYYRSRSGKVYLSARRGRRGARRGGRKGRRGRGRGGRRLKMTKAAIAARRYYRRRKARMSFFG